MFLQTVVGPGIYDQVEWKTTEMVAWLKHNEERFTGLGLFHPEKGTGLELITAF